jgi:superfamily II DNA or RNA helicase
VDHGEGEAIAGVTNARLQASWSDDAVVVWAADASRPPTSLEELEKLVEASGGGAVEWAPHDPVRLPSGESAPALTAPLSAVLGWLVSLGPGGAGDDDEVGASVRWMADVATWATEVVAQGRMVPRLGQVTEPTGKGRAATARYALRWRPALLDRGRRAEVAARMPGAVAVLAPDARGDVVCQSLLAAAVDALCRAGAARLVSPATVPVARNRMDVSEAVVAGLDGTPFVATVAEATRIADALGRWAAPVTERRSIGLVVELHPPDPNGGWPLSVTVRGAAERPVPLRHARQGMSRTKRRQLDDELDRLERLLPALARSRKAGRGVLDGTEAWGLMTGGAVELTAAGFNVRVPAASPRRPRARLQLHAERRDDVSKVGAQQLARVQWSVLFDDVELDAEAIRHLAKQARPMLRTGDQWVELDHDDLAAAADALAERADLTELSGAAILRNAVGLEDNPFAESVVLAGEGWGVDLVRQVASGRVEPLPAPDGFVGELRQYQAEARGWLRFLDGAGLGGCLALDMGLGKTPTVLAHLLTTRDQGPALVIAPPAVLGNWAAEAARFTPGLRVQIHHGADRASHQELGGLVESTDVVLTTYATAVRDIDALAGIDWHRIVLDEAQTIKNPAGDTARQLRRLPAAYRLALTGTPIENSLGDLWSILDFVNPGLVGPQAQFTGHLSGRNGSSNGNGNGAGNGPGQGESALRALNGLLVFRRTKAEPEIAAELPDRIDELDHCGMTAEQIGLYQAILDRLLDKPEDGDEDRRARNANVLAAITALKQVCNHPVAYLDDGHDPDDALAGRSGKLARLDEIVDSVFAAGERILVFTHFARWGERLARYLSDRTEVPIACYHGGLTRTARDRLIAEFQQGTGPGALVLSIKAGGSGLNLTAANHVVLYDRWWNPAVEDQARDRAWRIGQEHTVVVHRLVCPGTIDERVEEIVAGKRQIADLTLPARSNLGDLDADQLRKALGLRPEELADDPGPGVGSPLETSAA